MTDPRRHTTGPAGFGLLLLALLFAVTPAGCGSKGTLTLKSWEPPPSPLNITAIHREDSITLLWAFPEEKRDTVSGFVVTRETSAGPRREFRIEAGETSFIDREFLTGETYRYTVRAVNSRGVMSANPVSVSAAPRPAPPPLQRPSVTVSGDAVVLSWEGPAGQLYNIYRRTGDEAYGMQPFNPTPLKVPSFTDCLNLQAVVRYAVRASFGTDIRDEGALSPEVVVDPQELSPPSPRNLVWHAVADRVIITWDEAEASWVTGYRIYRRTQGQAYVLAGETQLPYFVDTDTPTVRRDYRITARGPVREGLPAEITGIALPPADQK